MEQLKDGMYEYKITENKGNKIPSTARSLHNQGRSKGGKGDYKGAIKTLKAAIKQAPQWEYPYYDLAYTYLLQQDYKNALKYYKTTDKLFNKGFFTTKTAVWSLTHELETKKLKKGLYSDYLMIEYFVDESLQKESYKKFAELYPEYAPAWAKTAALENDDMEAKQNAIDNGLKLIDTEIGVDAETKGMLFLQQAIIYSNNNEKEKAKRTLADLIMADDVTFHNQNMGKFFLQTLTSKSKPKNTNDYGDKQDL